MGTANSNRCCLVHLEATGLRATPLRSHHTLFLSTFSQLAREILGRLAWVFPDERRFKRRKSIDPLPAQDISRRARWSSEARPQMSFSDDLAKSIFISVKDGSERVTLLFSTFAVGKNERLFRTELFPSTRQSWHGTKLIVRIRATHYKLSRLFERQSDDQLSLRVFSCLAKPGQSNLLVT
ncbi:hypothetical protein SCHPADRAFT_324070 [Schizopora paradoxa]|uniref:Uncharacterized protein n=1 Tax=Schizopora paradoxa TaxID=27342 RepID=A0A0H2RXG1_9AGAM|nr:hypothetical protein SCHPADRAFT_324070 [Schizopora paradoxa]